jgi:hypothetical protein
MKRVMVLLLAAVFLFAGAAFAADQPKGGAAKAAPAKTAQMTATGKIVELSDTMLRLERSAKGKVEAMEFGLEKPLGPEVKIGDKATVHYVSKDGKKVATKVNKAQAAAKKSGKAKKK